MEYIQEIKENVGFPHNFDSYEALKVIRQAKEYLQTIMNEDSGSSYGVFTSPKKIELMEVNENIGNAIDAISDAEFFIEQVYTED